MFDLRLRWQKKIGSPPRITKISVLGQVISFYLDKSRPSLDPTQSQLASGILIMALLGIIQPQKYLVG